MADLSLGTRDLVHLRRESLGKGMAPARNPPRRRFIAAPSRGASPQQAVPSTSNGPQHRECRQPILLPCVQPWRHHGALPVSSLAPQQLTVSRISEESAVACGNDTSRGRRGYPSRRSHATCSRIIGSIVLGRRSLRLLPWTPGDRLGPNHTTRSWSLPRKLPGMVGWSGGRSRTQRRCTDQEGSLLDNGRRGDGELTATFERTVT